MIEREKIARQVRKVTEKNKLNESFYPILEEFFFRSIDQYNWTEDDFNIAINRFEKVHNMGFLNLCYKYAFLKIKIKKAFVENNLENNIKSVYFDVDDLKDILKFKRYRIENFINTFMHELGHVVQSKMRYGYIYREMNDQFFTGIAVNYINGEDKNLIFEKGTIINEYAEVINATRLQQGNISVDMYDGYEQVQYAGKVILSSLGLSEIEFSNLQNEGRDSYEKAITSKLENIPSQIYIDSFEEILDCLYNFSLLDGRNNRKNIIAQVDALQTLSDKLFQERFENIISNANLNLIDLAKLVIDEGNKEQALMQLFDYYNIKSSELEINEGDDIHTKLCQIGYGDEFFLKLYDAEIDERLKLQEIEEQNKKEYDNEELIEKIYESFLKYPIKNVPFRDIPGVVISKMIGIIKRRSLHKDTKMLVGKETYTDAHMKFVSRMSDFNRHKVIKNIRNTEDINKGRTDKSENSR